MKVSKQLFSQSLGQGPDLVLLHGWGFHSGVWQPLLPQLTQYFRVTVVDLPGFGRSLWCLQSYDLEQVCAQLSEVVPQQAAYLGWSMGGLVASYFAVHYPERVSQLINVAMSPCFVQQSQWPGIEKKVLQYFMRLAEKDEKQLLLRFLQLQFGQDQPSSAFYQDLKQVMLQFMPSKEALISGLYCLLETDLRLLLNKIAVPQLYLFGQQDQIVPAETASALTRYTESATIEVLLGGHALFWQQQSAVIDLIRGCLPCHLSA